MARFHLAQVDVARMPMPASGLDWRFQTEDGDAVCVAAIGT